MASVAPSSDQAADLLQKLSLDTPTKTLDVPEPPTKKASAESGDVMNGSIQDPTMSYVPSYPSATYYYGGYDGTGGDWANDYSRYLTPEGVDMSHGVYGDNGSIMYHHAYGYAPYSPYSPATSPVPTVGHDGQLYGAQQYQYPTPYFQPLTPTSGTYHTSATPAKGEISISAAANQASLSVDSANGNSNGIGNGVGVKSGNVAASVRPTYQNSSYNTNSSYGRGGLPGGMVTPAYQDPRYGFDGMRSPIPWLDGPIFSDGQHRPVTNNSFTSSVSTGNNAPLSRNQNLRPHTVGMLHTRPMSGMNTANGYMNRMYPTKLYGQYGNTYRAGIGYGSNAYDSRSNGRGWPSVDNKYKPRGRGNGFFGFGNDNLDGLNELNRGPRAKSSKNEKNFAPVALAVKGQNIPLQQTNDTEKEKEKTSLVPDRELYNKADFSETYGDAKFFIIKSYSEDDVHKSVKYNVWASTPNGNKKLDAAYQEAQQKCGGCPVFLFFSVNTSGQFVGVAEMVGPVDFTKNLEYWQQDKWVGCFPVRWHIVKDVPNSLLKHITLENNENKPVTNSRDTQEVKLEQGLQVLKIFKEHSSKQCILDDFEFYEERQKRIQEKKAKQQQFQKQVWEGKSTEDKSNDGTNWELKAHKSSEVSSVVVKGASPAVQANGHVKVAENGVKSGIAENDGSVVKPGEVPKGAKPVSEKNVANGC